MLLVDFFDEQDCKGTELVEGWYWHEDDGPAIGGPYDSQEAASNAARAGQGW